ncbi:MAG TPA: hypothetical protein DCF63_12350 [Planctomycetaceae bacterium]|nr:hypothetical protein [Planctomycetaceae bacterium]
MLPLGYAKSHGLTLLELVVVLGILAALSTVAIRSLEPVADQARYQQSQKLLDELRNAVVGESNLSASNVSAMGFVADTGALPANAHQLLQRPVSLIDRTLHVFDSDRDTVQDVQLVGGWNGPYLQFGAGRNDVVDGWGRAPTFLSGLGSLEMLSLGSDGDSTSPEDGYREDIIVSVQSTDYMGTLVLRLFAIDGLNGSRVDPSPTGSQQLGVLCYAVNAAGGTTGAIEEQLIVIGNSGSFEYRRDNTIKGTLAVRAILWNDVNNDDVLDIGESIVNKSIVHYVTVQARVDNRVEMELR